MHKTLCPAGCGKKFTTQEFADKHADSLHDGWRVPKSRGWRTPWGFIDFAYPVTYEYACKEHKEAFLEFEAMMAGKD